jgi:hypothetical protein
LTPQRSAFERSRGQLAAACALAIEGGGARFGSFFPRPDVNGPYVLRSLDLVTEDLTLIRRRKKPQ